MLHMNKLYLDFPSMGYTSWARAAVVRDSPPRAQARADFHFKRTFISIFRGASCETALCRLKYTSTLLTTNVCRLIAQDAPSCYRIASPFVSYSLPRTRARK